MTEPTTFFSKFCLFWMIGLLSLMAYACAVHPKNDYDESRIPIAPDYSKAEYWAALPMKKDMADSLPSPDLKDVQAEAEVDVFFLHPTIYTNRRGNTNWNGPVNDPKLNERVDEGTILYQASIFNGVGRVFAPRYRQAHLYSYYTKKEKAAAIQAFELAYSDVAEAFRYYLDHYNEGRPIVLACHSQGSTHGIRLLQEFFDGRPVYDQLVVAYLIGMPVARDTFQQIPLCETEEQTGCYCSWRTFKRGHEPKAIYPQGTHIAVTNPLTWTTQSELIPKTKNMGGVLLNFEKILPELANAQINNGILWTDKPKFPWSFLYFSPNYHAADFNLYYMNVRENAQLRVKTFLNKKK